MPSLLAEPVDREQVDLVISYFAIAQILVGVGAVFGLFGVEVRLAQSALARMAHTDSLTGLAEPARPRDPFRGGGGARFPDGGRVRPRGLRHRPLQGRERHPWAPRGRRGAVPRGRVLADAKRTEDVLGRLGGEEFVVMLCGHQSGGSAAAANRLRELVPGHAAGARGHGDRDHPERRPRRASPGRGHLGRSLRRRRLAPRRGEGRGAQSRPALSAPRRGRFVDPGRDGEQNGRAPHRQGVAARRCEGDIHGQADRDRRLRPPAAAGEPPRARRLPPTARASRRRTPRPFSGCRPRRSRATSRR